VIFELVQDFRDVMAAIPPEHPKRRMLELLEQGIRRDIHFIDRHPTTLFQCMWNTCWWYDCPEAKKYYEEPEGGWTEAAPWNRSGPRGHDLLEAWRRVREATFPEFHWVRSLRPPPPSSGAACTAVLRGHTCPVQCVAFARDGRLLVSCSAHLSPESVPLPEFILHGGKRVPVAGTAKDPYPTIDNTIRVWDYVTDRELVCVTSPDGQVVCCAFSPDGQSIAYSGANWGAVRVIGTGSGEQKACFLGHEARVNRVVFSPDGQWIASASHDGTIRVREARTGADWRCLRGHRSPVLCVVFSPKGELLASGSATSAVPGENSLRIWSMATGKPLFSANLPDLSGILSVGFSPDGQSVAAACFDYRVLLFTIVDGVLHERTLGSHDGEVLSVAFDRSGQRVVSGSNDRTVRVWDVRRGTELACLRGHLDIVNSVAFSPDGRFIASGSADCTVRLWDTARRTEYVRLHDHERDVVDLAFAAEGSRIVSASQDGTLRVWDQAGVQLQERPDSPQVRKIIAVGSGQRALAADYYHIRIHDLTSMAVLPIGPGNPNSSPADASALQSPSAGLTSGSFEIHTTPDGEKVGVYRCVDVEISDFAVTEDGERVIAGCWNGDLRIWQVSNGKEVDYLKGSGEKAKGLAFSPSENRMIYEQEVTCLALSRDGKRIVTGAADGTVRLSDMVASTGKGHRRHRSAVRSITFSPDQASVASGAADGVIVVWTFSQPGFEAGSAFREFRLGESAVAQIAFSPNGLWIVAVCAEKTVRLNPLTGDTETMPGRGDAAAVAAGMSRAKPQAMVHPLETAFAVPFSGEVMAWFPAPLACLRAQPGRSRWAGTDVNHLCLLLLE